MHKKLLLASLFSWVTSLYALDAAAWQAADVLECPVNKQNSAWLDCVPEDVPARLPYKMDDGSVQVLETRGTVFCKDGTCEYYYQRPSGLWDSTGEYAGQIQKKERTLIVLLRGYYLGNAKDGRIVAYLKGTGPESGGEMAAPLKVSDSTDEENSPEVSACVDKWATVFRKQNGENLPIMYDMLQEWAGLCKEGKQP